MYEVNEKVGSKYRLIVLAAQRAKQLMMGAEPRVDLPTEKAVPIAIKEIMEGKLNWKTKEVSSPVHYTEPGNILIDQSFG
jgi:DNA-directed RNA polymerase subunit omega